LKIDRKIPEHCRTIATDYRTIYVVGGVGVKLTWEFNFNIFDSDTIEDMDMPDSNMFLITNKTDMNISRNRFGIVFDKDQKFIYVIAGYSHNNIENLSDCEKYDIQANKWIKIGSLHNKKSGISCCLVNNMYIYAIGGYNGDYRSNEIEKYNIAINKWD